MRENRLNGLFPLSYVGVIPVSPQNFIQATAAPTSADAKNFYIGDIWLDYSSDTAAGGYVKPTMANLWILVSLDGGSATWINFLGAAGTVITLTGNDGLAATALAGNINVKGDGTFINITRSPDIHSLLVSPGPNGLVQSLTGNSGGAVFPTAGNINVLGTGVITVVGNPGTSTLTITPSGSIASSFPTDSGTAVPSAGALNIITSQATNAAGITTLFTGSGNTVLFKNTDANGNVNFGKSSGKSGQSGLRNSGFGQNSLSAITSSSDNSAIGFASLNALTSGTGENTALGSASLLNLVNGVNNISIGFDSGDAYTTNESNNIVIGSLGVVADSATTRIGTNGTQTKCFVCGIDGVNVGNNTVKVVSMGSAGTADQLGTVNIVGGTNVTVVPTANTITINATGGGTGKSFVGTDGITIVQLCTDTTSWISLYDPSTGTQADHNFPVPVAGIFSNMYVYVTQNTSAVGVTITLNKNNVNTALVVSIGAGATGTFSDTTHSVAFVAGDLLQWEDSATDAGKNVKGVISMQFTA